MIRIPTLCISLALLGAACGTKAKEAPPPPPPAAGSGSSLAAPVPVPVTAGSGSSATPAADAYTNHMTAGDALEAKKQWADALVEFEAALAARPGDPKALAEVGFNAYRAGNIARAKDASELAVDAAGSDVKLKGSALFNLGLAVEKTMPYAAASLYAASAKVRPNGSVSARLAALVQSTAAVRTATPEGDALLAKHHVEVASLGPQRQPATPIDRALYDALVAADVPFEGGMSKEVALVLDVACTESKAHDAACAPLHPQGTDAALPVSPEVAKVIVDNFKTRKIAGVAEGDHTLFKVASIRCASYDAESDDNKFPPDKCDVTEK